MLVPLLADPDTDTDFKYRAWLLWELPSGFEVSCYIKIYVFVYLDKQKVLTKIYEAAFYFNTLYGGLVHVLYMNEIKELKFWYFY